MNGYIRRIIRKRNRLHKKAKRSNLPEDWAKFRYQRNHVTGEVRRVKTEFYQQIDHEINENNFTEKKWWKLVKTNILNSKQNKSFIPPLVDEQGKILYDAIDKANALNNYFTAQSNLENSNEDPPFIPANDFELETPRFKESEIRDIITSLTVGKASGPDCINHKILKSCCTSLANPLTNLFNFLLENSVFPDQWKEAHVTPILKKGTPSSINNYRPISLLSCIGKIFERCLYKYIYNFFLDHKILTPLQSGFIKNDSTVYQLLDIYDQICIALDEGKEVRSVYFDISKAFDRVWHRGLLSKLHAVGIRGNIHRILESYLSNRQQSVVIDGVSSNSSTIHAGVPQGSVLGPLLFVAYINDLVNDVTSNIRLFADDTSLYLIIEDPASSQRILNLDLCTISKWASTWKVAFNPNKTTSITFSRKQNPSFFQLTFNNTALSEVSSHKHLGVYLQKNCNWTDHVNYIISKISKTVDHFRIFKYRLSRHSLETIYKSFILPLFDYADVL
ncbi:hypothetical protein SNE40_005366 [Patella caerulea]|uniref:Reverse transcriptase domain-containing protein n=1 Tax=Patella caerulea TaxID=87958 RepID=A0AAN8QBB5_PATCE